MLSSMKTAAVAALDAHEIAWAAPLVTSLERARPGASLDWSLASFERILPTLESTNAQTLAWLAGLRDMWERARQGEVSSEEPARVARAIWEQPGRNPAQTALHRLYSALAARIRGMSREAAQDVNLAMDVIVRHPSFSRDLAEIMLSRFDEHMERAQQGQ
ncbi:uncharacterized protein SOCE26_011460 [Sorangium cellulosum]|uniref:Uncharacterized protein n=1 Tax=Sorangium cellulosum TaxID=56 RepID=A0A2L0EKC6_SORCE|nr:hypothetical protein [Sorangium cellulosum]AUX39751.1 uncharacterized protein SOCE26_011460 [Sorangium cellulosum]